MMQVLSELSNHKKFDTESLDVILGTVAKGSTTFPPLLTIQCIAHLCGSQQIQTLPKKCVGYLIKLPVRCGCWWPQL